MHNISYPATQGHCGALRAISEHTRLSYEKLMTESHKNSSAELDSVLEFTLQSSPNSGHVTDLTGQSQYRVRVYVGIFL